MILDTNDKNWEGYFTTDEIKEIKAFEKKNFETLPSGLEEYIDSLKKYTNADTLESKLTEVPDCPARDWVRRTLLDHLRLFKYNRELILYNYTKEDLLRRVYLFLDTVLDDSKLNCYGYIINPIHLFLLAHKNYTLEEEHPKDFLQEVKSIYYS